MIILKHANFIDYQTFEIKPANILVYEGTNGKIEFLKESELSQYPHIKTIECKGKFVTKSFGCGHHHAYSALARGLPAPSKNPTNFYEILEYLWWKLDKALDKESIEASALATAIACAKNGVTFVIDHHSSPSHIMGSLDIIADAFERVGISHLLCYEITDRNGEEKVEQAFAETQRYLANKQGLVGLHASFTLSNESIYRAVHLAEKNATGIHIHVAEDKFDQSYTMREYGRSVLQRLSEQGALTSSKTILAHCIHLDDNEKIILKNSPVFIAQNTESNLNNQVGFFNSEWLGENIMLGTDGMNSDMIRSAKYAFFAGKNFDEITFPGIYKRFRKIHEYLSINKFEGDGDNNLVILDYRSPTEMNAANFLGHFVFGWDSRDVRHVISNGKLIVENSEILTVNENEILEFCKIQANRLWQKYKA